jgi:hypothetical protein
VKVKVGDTIYDAEDQPIMVILTERDKQNIANMRPDATKYCEFKTSEFTDDEIDIWMGDGLAMEEMK